MAAFSSLGPARLGWRIAGIGLLAAATLHAAAPALAEGGGYFNLILENDSAFRDSDEHYTHGTRLSYVGEAFDPSAPGPYHWLAENLSFLPVFQADGASRVHWFAEFGQSIFTPADKDLRIPDPNDRPYAGWLYAGFGYLRDTEARRLDHVQFSVGVVGPHAYAEQIQNGFHDLVGLGDSNVKGWDHQLHDEPGIVLAMGRKWREGGPIGGGLSADVIPQVNVALGNVFTYAAAGGMLRFGQNMGFDYGPSRIMPALSGNDYFDERYLANTNSGWGWYFFVGGEGRVVGRNIFLDGNTFRDSPSVDKNILVGDLQAGVAVAFASSARVSLSYIWRSDEFENQNGADQFASVNITVRF